MSSRAAVIYPFPNLRESGWGNSLRASLLIRYLAERATSVETVSVAELAADEREGTVHHRRLAAPAWRQHLDRWRLRLTRLRSGTDASFARGVLARFDEPRQLTHFDTTVRAVIGGSDVAFVEYPFWMPSVAPICRQSGVPVVLSLYDIHTFAHRSQRAIAAEIAARELAAIRMADVVFCTSGEDRDYLAAQGIAACVATNPIDVAGCQPADADAVAQLRADHHLGDGRLCMFVGSRIVPNMEAAEAVERLAPGLPDCTFVIAGRCASPGRRNNVVRLGWLDAPALRALYAASEAVVMPLASGTGTSLKFVEALAYGKAIVATTVAARGYAAESGAHAHIAAGVVELTEGLRRVLDDVEYRKRLETGARTLATRYDFHTVFEPYGALLRKGR